MVDIKPVIFKQLKEIPGVKVTDAYPKDWNKMPHISFYEQVNRNYSKTSKEYLTEVIYQIDIWHNRSTGDIAKEVDKKLSAIGLIRQMARDIPDPNIKHKTMRYRGIIDKRNFQVYQ